MKILSLNNKRAGFALLSAIAIGAIFLAVVIAGAGYMEYQKIKSNGKIGGQFEAVGSQIKMDTPLDALKEIYNGLVNSFFAPVPRTDAPINLDSLQVCVPSTSCISFCEFGGDLQNCRTTNTDCSVTLSTKGTSCLPAPKSSRGTAPKTTANISCLVSNQSFQNALTAYEITVPAYEKAAAAAKLPCANEGCAVVSENYANAYQRLRDAFNMAMLSYEEILPKCSPSDRLKAETCVAKYEKALAGCTPGQPTDPCFFADTEDAINSCFR